MVIEDRENFKITGRPGEPLAESIKEAETKLADMMKRGYEDRMKAIKAKQHNSTSQEMRRTEGWK